MEYVSSLSTHNLYCVTLLYLTGESIPEIVQKFPDSTRRISELNKLPMVCDFREIVSLCRKALTLPSKRREFLSMIRDRIPAFFHGERDSILRVQRRYIYRHLWAVLSLFPPFVGFDGVKRLFGLSDSKYRIPLDLARMFRSDFELLNYTFRFNYNSELSSAINFLSLGDNCVLFVDGENNRPYQLVSFCKFTLKPESRPFVFVVAPFSSAKEWEFAASETGLPFKVIISTRITKDKSLLDFDLFGVVWDVVTQGKYSKYAIMASDSDYSKLFRVLPTRSTTVIYSYPITSREYLKFLCSQNVKTVMMDISVDSINSFVFSYRFLNSFVKAYSVDVLSDKAWTAFLSKISWNTNSTIARKLRNDLLNQLKSEEILV